MFDYENPFMEAVQAAEEDLPVCDPAMMEVEPDWENAEWEEVCNSPQHQAEGDEREAAAQAQEAERTACRNGRREMFANFHERNAQHRKERMQIDAFRYAGIALACGLLAYTCSNYGISWLAWILGCASGISAITSSYGFGRVHEFNKIY